MCGICGLVNLSTTLKKDSTAQLEIMATALMHRGPDDTGIAGDEQAMFGMTRLAIRGIHDGKQPIIDKQSGVMMVCNGEIDNHVELRDWLLSRGRVVQQATDVAVILALYLELGDAFVERLEGMFAVAIWDPEKQQLLLARDRAGERPLFYTIEQGVIAFASLISALVEAEATPATVDSEAIKAYLQSGYFLAPNTSISGIQKVAPGEIITLKETGIQRRYYWQWSITQTSKHHASVEDFDEVFRQAVYKQSEVDVNFGLFLSGGLDSSLITAVTRSLHPNKSLTAYSLRFSEASYDEGHFAEQVAKNLGVDFVPVWVQPEDFPPTIRRLVRQIGEPLADPAWVPTALLARRATQDISVALVGEGADELFGGYPTYFGAGIAQYYAKLPHAVRNFIRHSVEGLPPNDKKVTLTFLLKRFILGDNLDYLNRHKLWTATIAPEILQRLGVNPAAQVISPDLAGDMLDQLQRYDLRSSLAEGLLTKADRASMKSALELRTPFLDVNVMEFAARLEKKQRVQGVQTKVFLKQYALKYLPKEIVYRKKRGLSVPLSRWLRQPLYEWAKNSLSSPHLESVGIRPQAALQLLQEHSLGKVDHARAIWTLIVLSEWLEWLADSQQSH
jgi:asparagine synthase (glutamine-hydrolysing)